VRERGRAFARVIIVIAGSGGGSSLRFWVWGVGFRV
jgi:hypothetical protein